MSYSTWSLVTMSITVLMAVEATLYRKEIAAKIQQWRRRVLMFQSMSRRYENRRLERLNSSSTDTRHSEWMWSPSVPEMDDLTSESSGDADSTPDGLVASQKKLVLVMVGLPARGKSFVVHKMIRYIEWLGYPTKIFNVGNYRRNHGKTGEGANFFSADNEDAKKMREEMAMAVLDDLLNWLDEEGHVAVFDATNTTKERRGHILQKVKKHHNVSVMFVESICDRQDLLEANYRRKCSNDDYSGKDPEQALKDFRKRVEEYSKVYQTVEDSEDDNKACYVKVYNAGEKIQARFCQGFLPSHIVSLLENIHLFPRRIWLVQAGPSTTALRGILGLDTELSPEGHRVAVAIADFIEGQTLQRPMEVWTGAMKAPVETAQYLPLDNMKRYVSTTLLNELGGGDFEGLTYDEIEQFYPKHFKARQENKLHYRYPGVGGESYVDVISRVRSLIIEFERKKRDVLVICNASILRCLYGYFSGCDASKVPYLEAYTNTVIELSPHRDGCDIKKYPLDADNLPDIRSPISKAPQGFSAED